MARPPKMGLDYFPKDVDFYDDFKIIELLSRYGPSGVTIYDFLLTQIYKSGYYIEMPIENVALLAVRAIGSQWVTKEFVSSVITYCGGLGLFRVDLLEQGILTSASIQKRYAEVTTKRKFHNGKYWVLDENKKEIIEPVLNAPLNRVSGVETGVSGAETGVSGAEMPQNKKETKRKQKEKGKERKECAACDDSLSDYFSDEDFAHVVSEFEHSGFMLSGRARDELIDMLDTYSAEWTIEAIHRAADRGKKSIAYIRGILNNWQQKGAIDDERSSNTSKDSSENKSVIDFSDGWTVV